MRVKLHKKINMQSQRSFQQTSQNYAPFKTMFSCCHSKLVFKRTLLGWDHVSVAGMLPWFGLSRCVLRMCCHGAQCWLQKLTAHLHATLKQQDRQGSLGLSGLCTAPTLLSSPEGQKCHHIHHSCSRTTHTVAMGICHFFSPNCAKPNSGRWVGAEIRDETKRIVCMLRSVCM